MKSKYCLRKKSLYNIMVPTKNKILKTNNFFSQSIQMLILIFNTVAFNIFLKFRT